MAARPIHTPKAPQPIGPYSQAIIAGSLVFVSGQIAIDAASGEVMHFDGDVARQTEKALENLKNILAAADLTLEHVVKTTIYLVSMDDYKRVNEVYGRFFANTKPARAAVAVKGLPGGVRVEIEAIACRSENPS